MLQLLKGLDFERYEPRSYIISEGDQLSASKAAELEDSSDYLSVRVNNLCMNYSNPTRRIIQ